jgi:hypothetical protein
MEAMYQELVVFNTISIIALLLDEKEVFEDP